MVHIFWKLGNSKSPLLPSLPIPHPRSASPLIEHFDMSPVRDGAPRDRRRLLIVSHIILTYGCTEADIARLAFKGWTFKSPQSRPTPPFFPEFTPSRLSQNDQEMYKYGHGLEQDLSHLRDMSGNGSEDSNSTITPGQGTMRCRALSF